MKMYELYYKDLLIAKLYIYDDNNISYKVCMDNIINSEYNVSIFNFLKVDMNYLHPFLKSRIEKMDLYNLNEINYENDYYFLVYIK